MKDKEVKKIKKEINKLRKQKSIIEDIINVKTNVLIENCPHKKTKTDNEFHEGGYLYRGIHIEKEVCTICGKEISRKKTLGSYG